MAFNKRILTRLHSVPVTTGRNFTRYAYATDDAEADTLAAGYFDAVSTVVKKRDLIDVVAAHGASTKFYTVQVTNVVSSGAVTVAKLT